MQLKLILNLIGPRKADPLEVWYEPKEFPSDSERDDHFFEDYLFSEFCEEVGDYFNSCFDLQDDILSLVMLDPKSRYSLEESSAVYLERAFNQTKKFVCNYRANYIFQDVENDIELFRNEFDLESYLNGLIEMRESDCERSIDVGEAMIRSMEQYVASAYWHYAFISNEKGNKPVMWFGLKNETPAEGWILNLEKDPATGKDWKSFWLCNDSWEDWKNRVPDADDIFLTWMTAECGISLPLLEDVLKSCPIDISEKDDYESLTQKIIDLIMEQGEKE